MRFIHQKRACPNCGDKNGTSPCIRCGTVLPPQKNRTMFIIIAVALVLLAVFSLAYTLLRSLPPPVPILTPVPSPSVTASINNGIGVKQVNGEDIGISDGNATFYTSPDDLEQKKLAADYMKKGHVPDAIKQWTEASQIATNDAEPLIYIEDQHVLDSHKPYITIVIGVALSPKKVDGFSRDFLQAAFFRQKECNDHTLHLIDANKTLLCPSDGKMLRLLIANSGSDPSESKGVAQQIVQAAKADPTIVAVLGWTTSETTVNVIPILQQRQLPIITASNAGDALSGQPDFFRTGSPISAQIPLIKSYISTKLNPQHMVIFDHNSDTYYSRELANSLHNQLPQSTPPIEYNASNPQAIAKQINDADVVFMATNNVQDLVTLLRDDIPADANLNANLKVFTGGTGYELVEAGQSNLPNYNRVIFCTPTFPDIWGHLGQGQAQFDFSGIYDATYNPNKQHNGDYTFSRPNSTTMLAYDDMLVLLAGSKTASEKAKAEGKQDFTPAELRDSLKQINDQHPLQGITGRIAFDVNGDPTAKTNLILRVDNTNSLHLMAHDGCFLVNTSCNNQIVLTDQ